MIKRALIHNSRYIFFSVEAEYKNM